jgi:hypothetical protein
VFSRGSPLRCGPPTTEENKLSARAERSSVLLLKDVYSTFPFRKKNKKINKKKIFSSNRKYTRSEKEGKMEAKTKARRKRMTPPLHHHLRRQQLLALKKQTRLSTSSDKFPNVQQLGNVVAQLRSYLSIDLLNIRDSPFFTR